MKQTVELKKEEAKMTLSSKNPERAFDIMD